MRSTECFPVDAVLAASVRAAHIGDDVELVMRMNPACRSIVATVQHHAQSTLRSIA